MDNTYLTSKSGQQQLNQECPNLLLPNRNKQTKSSLKLSSSRSNPEKIIKDKKQLPSFQSQNISQTPLQTINSRKKFIKRNKLITKEQIEKQQIKSWLDQQPTIPFCFQDEISSISYRTQQITPQDSLVCFLKKSQFYNLQQSERFSQMSNYPTVPKYQNDFKSEQDHQQSSQMEEEQPEQDSDLQTQQKLINQIQAKIEAMQNQKTKSNLQNDKNKRYNIQKKMDVIPAPFNLPNPNRYIQNFLKQRQLIVLPEYESRIQDNSILAVNGIQLKLKIVQQKVNRPEQKDNMLDQKPIKPIKYFDFLPQLQKSQKQDNLRRQLSQKNSNQLKNEHNQKLKEYGVQSRTSQSLNDLTHQKADDDQFTLLN